MPTPFEKSPIDDATFEWSGRVWSKLTQQQCAAILWFALRYDQTRTPANTIAYIETVSQLPWRDMGRNLQVDLAHSFKQLVEVLR